MSELIFDEINHQYFIKNGDDLKIVPSVTQILDHFKMMDFSNVNEEILKNASDFGKQVHKACQLDDLNDLKNVDERIEPYLNQYRLFKEAVCPKWEIIEQNLYFKSYNICGTPDRAGIIKNKFCVLDIKTGVKKPADALQLAGYKCLIEENYKNHIKDNAQRYTLHLFPNKFELVKHENISDKRIFLYLADVYDWKVRNKLIK